MTPLALDLEATGRVWLRNALTQANLKALDAAFPPGSANRRIGPEASLSGILGRDSTVAKKLRDVLPNAFPTRVVSFSKSQGDNWGVPWHQDRIIAVAAKHASNGFENWSRKDGIWHCEPPVSLLDQMLFLRLHLDDDQESNGAMEIALGSHERGRIDASDADKLAADHPWETCHGRRGDVLVLKMLILHRSSPSKVASPRRVLRCDYANKDLPPPLAWTGWAST